MSFPVTSMTETAVQRAFVRATAAQVSMGAVILFAMLVALLHFIEPEFGPLWRFVSEYSNGAYGWVMKSAFFILALGCAAAIAVLRPHAQTKPARAGLWLLALTVIGLIMAGAFDQDSITSQTVTREGNLHAMGTMFGIPGFTLASLLLGLSLARRWKTARLQLLCLSQLPWISFVSMMVYMAITMPTAGSFGPDVWVGLINRLYLAAMCAWMLFVVRQAGRRRQGASLA